MPLNILLADDSVPAQNMGKKILVDAGYQVRTVSNGLEALRKIAEMAPDIVIMDIFMPGYTGLEVCERLRANEDTASLPVILTVGKLEPYRPEDGEHVHANAVIVKPFAAAELIAAVRSMIGAPPAEEADASPAHAGDSCAGELGADPLQDISFESAADAATHGHSASIHEQFAEPSSGTGPDDLVFPYGTSGTPEAGTPWASPEASHNSAELLLSSVDANGPNSLMFNPDAASTPFSASIIDFRPSPSHDLSGFDLATSATKESSFSAAVGVGHAGFGAAIALEAHPIPVPRSGTASEGTLPEWLPPAEWESSPALEVLAHDPGLELQPMAGDVLVPDVLDLGKSAAETVVEVAPRSVAGAEATSSYSEESAADEEERRRAFDRLFETTEPFLVDEPSPEYADGRSAAAQPDLSHDHSGGVAPDIQIESLSDDGENGWIAPESDTHSHLLQEEELVNETFRIPDRDPLLDDSFEPDSAQSASAEEPMQVAVANVSESASPVGAYSPLGDGPGELNEATEPLPPATGFTNGLADEAQLATIEARAEAPKVFEDWTNPASAHRAEIVEAVFDAAPLEPQTISDIEYADPQQALPELVHSEPELQVPDPPPVQEPEPQPAPVKEPEPQPAPVPPESLTSEWAKPRWDNPTVESASCPVPPTDALEAERIRLAVDRVFDRFKHLLVKAIVRELARQD